MPFDTDPDPQPRMGLWRLLGHLVALVMIPAIVGGALALAPALALGSGVNHAHSIWDELDDEFDLDHVLPGYTTVVDAEGNQVAQFYTENRIPLTRDETPDAVVDALVATEDATFFEHGGIDPTGIARALVSNATTDSRQGGSTITQQLVENVRLLRAQTEEDRAAARAGSALGKLQEMRYALALEREHTKDEILTAYLNTVYFGSRTYGLATAAHRHFSVEAEELTVPQAALLVGMLRSPTNYNPFTHPEAAKDRRDTVLWRMNQAGYLTEEEFEAEQEQAEAEYQRLVERCQELREEREEDQDHPEQEHHSSPQPCEDLTAPDILSADPPPVPAEPVPPADPRPSGGDE